MRGRLAVRAALTVAALLSAGAASGAAIPTPGILPSHPFATGVYLDEPDVVASPLAYSRVAAAGASVARILVPWVDIAPKELPTSWNPSDPADPNYDWSSLDQEVKLAVAHGLQPLLTVLEAPSWAQTGTPVPAPNSRLPDPAAFAQFATAAAERYGGAFQGLPRVRYWQGWNEPNISLYLVPQLTNGKPVSPAWYRSMLNAFAAAVHGVHADNVVVAAGLAPFRDNTTEVMQQNKDWGPLSFMRELLCLSQSLRPTCSDPVSFDVWAQHPYTSGGPTHDAVLPNDVSLGDLSKVTNVLNAAIKYGHIRSNGRPRFWVTEFSWDTKPPDPQGVPALLARRWTAEALYRMWTNGISLVTWLMLRDDPPTTSYLQSGLYYDGSSVATDRPKPLLAAFRFPVVGLQTGQGIYVWGRTPAGRRGSVVVQWRSGGGGWRRLAVVGTDQYGIFQATYAIPFSGWVRATLPGTSTASPPFQLANVPDHFYNPFGAPSLLEPGKHHK